MSRWIDRWEPDDPGFWERTGRSVARRNLAFSILAEFVGFSVWLVWSVVAVNLNAAGFDLSVDQLFWLVSVPALVGATLRLPYGAAVALVGGRNFTIFSAAVLLVPTVGLAVAVQNPATPYWALLLCAATAGLGGGNFASSMANISHFYPESRKGWALGLNAAGGNIGVSFVQLVVPAAIGLGVLGLGGAAAGGVSLAWAGWMWLPLIAAATAGAWLFMDNLTVARSPLREQARILGSRHTWVMSLLYVGTFGSFIGYSAALPLLITVRFPGVEPLHFAFLGPLVGSLARPAGGRLSDRLGGALVTVWTFAGMIVATLALIASLRGGWGFPAFLAIFMALFVLTGVGNGSTFRIIPSVFRREHLARVAGAGAEARARAEAGARRQAAAVLAFSSAVGAYGGFIIPKAFGTSISATGGPEAALAGFLGLYAVCVATTWLVYMRAGARAGAPAVALAEGRV